MAVLRYRELGTGVWTDLSTTGPKGDQGNIGLTGPQGIQGVKGDTGSQGPAGPGVPAGGSDGQFLMKTGAGNNWAYAPLVYATKAALDTAWPTPVAGMVAYTTGPNSTIEWTAQAGKWYRFQQLLGRAELTAPSTGNGGPGNVWAGMTVAINGPAKRWLRLHCETMTSSTVSGWVFVDILRETPSGQNVARKRTVVTANGGQIPVTLGRIIESTAGACQYSVWIVNPYSQGTATLWADTNEPSYFSIEDIGGVA